MTIKTTTYLRFFFVILLTHKTLTQHTPILGANPSEKRYFTHQKTFECFDKSQILNINAINDHYCDCPDGSDEPGTSACQNGVFYCVNKGFLPKYVFSSRVNDQICDCCDGSDEYKTPKKCINNCVELKNSKLKILRVLLKNIEKGNIERQHFLLKSKQIYEEKVNALKKCENELKFVLTDFKVAENIKNEFEELEKKEKEKLMKNESLTEITNKSNDKIDENESLDKDSEDLKGNKEENVQNFPFPKEYAFNNEKEINNEEKTLFKIGQRIAIIRNLNPKFDLNKLKKENGNLDDFDFDKVSEKFNYECENAFGKNYENLMTENGNWNEKEIISYLENKNNDEMDSNEDNEEEMDLNEDEKEEMDNEYKENKEHKFLSFYSKFFENSIFVFLRSFFNKNKVQNLNLSELEKAKQKFDEISNKKENLEKEISDLKKFFLFDFGSEKEFLTLENMCFSFSDKTFTYEFCPFHTSFQKQNGLKINIGEFTRWEVKNNTLKTDFFNIESETQLYMLFEGGESCWTGPNRSLKVLFQCGIKNEVISVNERKKCVYVMVFESPTVCSDKILENARKRYDFLVEKLK